MGPLHAQPLVWLLAGKPLLNAEKETTPAAVCVCAFHRIPPPAPPCLRGKPLHKQALVITVRPIPVVGPV